MGDWSILRHGSGPFIRAAQVEAAPVLLRAKYYVPDLWPALFDLGGTRAGPAWVVTPVADAIERLRGLERSVAGDTFFAVVWESIQPMIDRLAALAPGTSLVMDLREIARTQPPGGLRAELARAAETLAALRLRWSRAVARRLLPPWLDADDLERATLAARRFFHVHSPRAALFSLAFGWPDDEKAWEAWFDAGPTAPPLPPRLEEGQRLAELLEQRGLVAFVESSGSRKFRAGYLAIALRDRRVTNLVETLELMREQGIVAELRGEPDELAEVLAALDA